VTPTKFVPRITTCEPTGPLVGAIDVIVGAAAVEVVVAEPTYGVKAGSAALERTAAKSAAQAAAAR
jgi:hypothetical protein